MHKLAEHYFELNVPKISLIMSSISKFVAISVQKSHHRQRDDPWWLVYWWRLGDGKITLADKFTDCEVTVNHRHAIEM